MLKSLGKSHKVLELQSETLMNVIDEINCDHKEKLHAISHNHLELEKENKSLKNIVTQLGEISQIDMQALLEEEPMWGR